MRLSDFTPRVNNIPTGLGAAPDIPTLIYNDLTSWLNGLAYNMEQGGAHSPAEFQQVLTNDVYYACINWPGGCGDYSAQISAAVQQYSDAYAREYARVMAGIQSGTIYLPPSYTPPAYVPPSYVPPNALDNSAPGPTTVPSTGQTGGNVLVPPSNTGTGVTAGSVQNTQTQGGSQAVANGTSSSNTSAATDSGVLDFLTKNISDTIPIPWWMVIAGGVVGLVVLKD